MIVLLVILFSWIAAGTGVGALAVQAVNEEKIADGDAPMPWWAAGIWVVLAIAALPFVIVNILSGET